MPELTPEQRAQLDRGIKMMVNNGASEQDVMTYASDFRSKYDTQKKNGGVALASEAPSTSKTDSEWPFQFSRDITKQPKPEGQFEQKTIDAGKKLSEQLYRENPFKVNITDKHAEDIAIADLRSGKHAIPVGSQDPVRDLKEQMSLKEFNYPDYKVAKKKIELINDNFFQSGEEARNYLDHNSDKPDDNATKQLAIKRYDQYKKVEDALHGASSLDEAAVMLAANKGDEQVKYLLDAGGGNVIGTSDENSNIPMAVRGEKMLQMLLNKDFKDIASKDPQLKTSMKEEIFNFPNRYPEYAEKLLAEAIAEKRDEKGLNNVFANIVSKETTDNIVDELIKEGKFPSNYKLLYEKDGGIRSRLGTAQSIGRGIGNAIPGLNQVVNEAPIPTSGFLENFEQGFENFQVSTAKSILNLPSIVGAPTLIDVLQPREQQTFNVIKKEHETPIYEPKSTRGQIALHGGQMAAFVMGLAGGTSALQASRLITSPGLASATMMLLGTHGDTVDQARSLFPRNDFKQTVYVDTMGAFNTALGKFLPGQQIPKLLAGGKETVANILKKMVDGEITTSAARNSLMEWFGNTAKSTLSGAEFMAAISAADDALKQTLEGKDLNLGQTFEAGWHGFKTGLIATPILGAFEASLKTNKGFREQIIDLAQNSEHYKELTKSEALKDPELNKIKDDIINNLDYVGKVWKEIEGKDMSEKEKQKYLLNSLSEKIKLGKAEEATDPTLKKRFQQEAKDISEVKNASLNGVPEENVKLKHATREVKELYEYDVLSKAQKEMLESKTTPESEPKFDEKKIKSFLKFIAQQHNNIKSNGEFDNKTDLEQSRKAIESQYPKQLVEIANEMFPKYGEVAEGKREAEIEVEPTPEKQQEIKDEESTIFNQDLTFIQKYKTKVEVIDPITKEPLMGEGKNKGKIASAREAIGIMKERYDLVGKILNCIK